MLLLCFDLPEFKLILLFTQFRDGGAQDLLDHWGSEIHHIFLLYNNCVSSFFIHMLTCVCKLQFRNVLFVQIADIFSLITPPVTSKRQVTECDNYSD